MHLTKSNALANIHYMYTATITSQGQLTLPAPIRKALGITGSQKVNIQFDSERRTATIAKPLSFDEITKLAQRYADPTAPPVLDVDAYYQAHRHETIR